MHWQWTHRINRFEQKKTHTHVRQKNIHQNSVCGINYREESGTLAVQDKNAMQRHFKNLKEKC